MGPPLFSGGNAWASGHGLLRPGSFNGAAAVQRRKCLHLLLHQQALAKLQWGRRCSAAEISSDASALSAALMLQWGRRCSAAEIPEGIQRPRRRLGASMGPPLFSGGNDRVLPAQ